MKKLVVTIMISIISYVGYSQIGINTITPKSTLDVVGKPTLTTEPDGIKVTNITGNELKAKDASYGVDQNGVMVYVTAIPSPTTSKTIRINEVGYYYFDGSIWQKLAGKNSPIIGDVKHGFQTADHNGWILLNGRLASTLTALQIVNATTLGFTTNLPNATNAYLSNNATTLGSLANSNTTTLIRSQLPNITLTGSTNNTGAHTHSYQDRGIGAYNASTGANPIEDDGELPRTTGSSGNHTHTITTESLNGNVTQTTIDKRPLTMSVNVFVYLGE